MHPQTAQQQEQLQPHLPSHMSIPTTHGCRCCLAKLKSHKVSASRFADPSLEPPWISCSLRISRGTWAQQTLKFYVSVFKQHQVHYRGWWPTDALSSFSVPYHIFHTQRRSSCKPHVANVQCVRFYVQQHQTQQRQGRTFLREIFGLAPSSPDQFLSIFLRRSGQRDRERVLVRTRNPPSTTSLLHRPKLPVLNEENMRLAHASHMNGNCARTGKQKNKLRL